MGSGLGKKSTAMEENFQYSHESKRERERPLRSIQEIFLGLDVSDNHHHRRRREDGRTHVMIKVNRWLFLSSNRFECDDC